MSPMYSRQTTPSPSVTLDHHEVKQISAKTGDLEARFLISVDRDYDTITLLTIASERLIQNELTYETASALYFALSDALDALEASMIPTIDDESGGASILLS